MAIQSKTMTVTAVTHLKTGGITAFFNELPGLVVQGYNEDDIRDKLSELLDDYIKRLNASKNNIHIQNTSLV